VPGTVRVVSYNVLHSAPQDRPAPFGRIFRALDPDVVLVQEWDEADAAEIQEWFAANVPGHAWRARKSAGRGVAVVARHAMKRYGPFRLPVGEEAERLVASSYFGSWVGFVAASIETPLGPLLAASVHLTACGDPGSPEDWRRVYEAAAINAVLGGAISPFPHWRDAIGHGRPPPMLLLGGDLNLVGSQHPLSVLRAGLDVDGASLSVAEPHVLGTTDTYTWRDATTPYGPGRLDWLLYSGTTVGLRQAFVLDTVRLAPAALAAHDLQAGDTGHSDHLPVVLDISSKQA
jgi:endonuclease/exonuclease/phosphatase family metal-dependent hydrolase